MMKKVASRQQSRGNKKTDNTIHIFLGGGGGYFLKPCIPSIAVQETAISKARISYESKSA
ncbi:hypothetical protein PilKf_00292 [Pillotina sp. SPG140]|jgi:hypothetical protein